MMKVHKTRCLLVVWTIASVIGVCECGAYSVDEAVEAEQVQSAAVGQQVQLRCDTFSSKAVDWWFTSETNVAKIGVFVNEVMVGGYKDRVNIDNTKHNIIINNITLKDAGTYTCVEDSGQGKKYSIRLKVSLYMSAKFGEILTLPCYTAMTAIAWKYHRPKGLEKYIYKGTIYDEYVQRVKLLGLHSGYFSLQIIKAQQEDSGIYTCLEGNTTSPRLHTFQVIVYVVTSIGASITLPCHPNKPADVDWVRYKSLSSSDHEIVYSDSSIYPAFKDRFTTENSSQVFYNLQIKDIQMIDSGVYICIEDGGFLEHHLMELFVSGCVNTPTAVSNIVTVVGGSVKLTCPSTSVEWRYQPTPSERPVLIYQSATITRDYTGRFQVQKDNNGNQTLLIERTSAKDTGFYSCSPATGALNSMQCMRLEVKETDPGATATGDTPASFDQSNDSSSSNTALIVGLLVGVILTVIITILIVFIAVKRRKKRSHNVQSRADVDIYKDPQSKESQALMTQTLTTQPVADGVLCTSIQQLKDRLQYILEPETTIGALIDVNSFSIEQLHEIINAQEPNQLSVKERNQKLIEFFAHKSDDECNLFITALRQSNQEHVANFIITEVNGDAMFSDNDVRPLDKVIMAKLYKCIIIERHMIFYIDKFVGELLTCGCIFERHKKYITEGSAETEKNRRLVEVLTRRSVADYQVFLNCLMKQQEPLASLLSIDNKGDEAARGDRKDGNENGTKDDWDSIYEELLRTFGDRCGRVY